MALYADSKFPAGVGSSRAIASILKPLSGPCNEQGKCVRKLLIAHTGAADVGSSF